MFEMTKRVPHIAGTHLPHEVDDVPSMGHPVIEPDVFDGIDFEGGVFVPVSNGRVIPKLPATLAGFLRPKALAFEVLLEGDTFGLRDVHRWECYTDKSVWVVKRGREATVSLAILPLPLGVKNRAAAGPGGHGANGSRIRFDCLRGEGAVE